MPIVMSTTAIDARDHVAMKDGDHLGGGVLHRGDDDMTRVM